MTASKSTPLFNPLFNQAYPRGAQAFANLVNQNVQLALAEDIDGLDISGDLTAELIAETTQANATIISREAAVICGQDWFNACFKQVDKNVQIKWHINEGDSVKPNDLLCAITGNARALLSAERCALNFLQTLSAVATQTRAYVDVISGTNALICDTRKTLPGLRLAQKYAVTVGGGANQRLALYDGILIKENHIKAAGGILPALQAALLLAARVSKSISVQIEVENLDELQQALAASATSILLDNFSLSDMREAVQLTNKRALLEASGNVNLSTVRAIAETGVDRISIGALTKNIRAIDLSMRLK